MSHARRTLPLNWKAQESLNRIQVRLHTHTHTSYIFLLQSSSVGCVLVPPLAFMLEVHLLTLRQSIAGQCVSFVPSHKCDADKTWLLQETVLEVFHINMSIGLIKLVSHFLCSKCSGNLLIVERLFGGKLHELVFSKEAPTPAESEQSGSSQSHPCVEPLLLGHRLKANAVKRSLYKKMTFAERFGELN